MTAAFDAAITFLRPEEGGYSDDPGDSGGPTQFGNTLATLSLWRRKACTAADVKALTWIEAQAIYGANYWNPICGDTLPGCVALTVFDEGVNAGVSRSAMYLQKLVGAESDGWIGPETVKAVTRFDDTNALTQLSTTAAKALQGAVGVVADGDIGPITLAAVKAHSPYLALCAALYDAQATYYVSLDDPEFQRGWLNRAAARLEAALAFAKTSPTGS